MSSCKFPERRRLDVSASRYISIDSRLKSKAKEIVRDFISSQEELGDNDIDIRTSTTSSEVITENRTWKDKSQQITGNLLKQISFLKRQIIVNREHLSHKRNDLLKFIRLARANSLLAADLLHEGKRGVSTGRGQWLQRQKIRCCKVSNGIQCKETALLYSKYCLGHIASDKHQVLYQSCVTIDNDTSTKCNRPVLELLQEKPYCLKHMIETKKTIKLTPPSVKVQGIKHRVSPGLQKIKVQDAIKKATVLGLPSPLQPLPPLTSSFLPPPLSSSWSLTDNEGERNRPPGLHNLSSPTKDIHSLLPNSQATVQINLSPFSLDSTLPPPLPTMLLLPPDPTPGSFLDDDSSSNEGN